MNKKCKYTKNSKDNEKLETCSECYNEALCQYQEQTGQWLCEAHYHELNEDRDD
jgi:hypothetical protein